MTKPEPRTGECCRDFCLPISPAELKRYAKRTRITFSKGKDAACYSNADDIRFMAENAVYLRSDRQVSVYRTSSRKSGKRETVRHHYRCGKWDEATGLCGIYENRPKLCRDFVCRGIARCKPCQMVLDRQADFKNVGCETQGR